MVVYTDVMFNLGGAAVTTLTAMNFGTGSAAGAYAPQLDGQLLKVTIILGAQAATSLTEQGRVELSQTNWTPNIYRMTVAGFSLRTAPALYSGTLQTQDWVIDQPVKTSWPITGQVIYFFSPVTPAIQVVGTFRS